MGSVWYALISALLTLCGGAHAQLVLPWMMRDSQIRDLSARVATLQENVANLENMDLKRLSGQVAENSDLIRRLIQAVRVNGAKFGSIDQLDRIFDAAQNSTTEQQFSAVIKDPKPIEVQRKKEVLLAIGGYNETLLDSVELYDPEERGWRRVAPLPEPRKQHSATVLNGTVYVCGGSGRGPYWTPTFPVEEYKNTCMTYDPKTGLWDKSRVAPMNLARDSFSLAALDGRLYAIGGSQTNGSVEIYDPQTNKWSLHEKLHFPVNITRGAAAVLDGAIYVSGGHNDLSSGYYYTSLYNYDPQTSNTWFKLSDMTVARNAHTLVAVDGDQPALYAMGGMGIFDLLDSIEKYNVNSGKWEPVGSSPAAGKLDRIRYCPSGAFLNGELYAVGGYGGKVQLDSTVKRNLTRSGEQLWTAISPLSQARSCFALVKIQINQ